MKANNIKNKKENKQATKSRSFFRTYSIFIALIAVISIAACYTTFLYLQGAGGVSGKVTQGSLSIGSLTGGATNVIIVDNSIVDTQYEVGVPGDGVTFATAALGSSYSTQATVGSVYPFLIRNTGSYPADVSFYVDGELFDQTPANNPTDPSTAQVWVQSAAPIAGDVAGWANVDNCAVDGPCFKASDNKYPGDGGTCTTGCLNIRSAVGVGNPAVLIDSVGAAPLGLQKDKPKNEAYLNVRIHISAAETPGAKNTIIHITGAQSL